MASIANELLSGLQLGRYHRSLPSASFVVAAAVILGACAANAALGHWVHQPNRDIFQHIAALRSLIADIHNPTNPFVDTDEPSRHFHPYWVTMAALARHFDWNVQSAIAIASFVNVSVLGLGYFLFGRSYFRSRWGPLALLLSSMLAWSFPISHTGYINIPTLVEGAAYPAVFLVGLSFVLWALVIESFHQRKYLIPIPFLVALMFSTHQLGAGLGFIVAACLIVGWPSSDHLNRLLVISAIAVGILASTLWPYFNPLEAVTRAGNPSWQGGVEWYKPVFLLGIFVPSALGVLGLIHPLRKGTGRPFLLALPILVAGFCAGAFGFMTGTRFAPTAALLLQIGLAAILVRWFEDPAQHTERFRITAISVIFATLLFQCITLGAILYPKESRAQKRYGDVTIAAANLVRDIPDNEEVAGYDVAAWPLVAQGQKVFAVPWPEPYISDLVDRQRKTALLFRTDLSRVQRRALAQQYGVRTLILDQRSGPTKKGWRHRQLRTLQSQARSTKRAGPLWRFDLY